MFSGKDFDYYVTIYDYDYDYVTIYDGSNDQSTEIAKLTGNLGKKSISSTGTSLFVKLKSNGFKSVDRFLATIHYGIIQTLYYSKSKILLQYFFFS